jgi:hypothetical protein
MFALAGHLGMTVAELGERMTASELSEWIALMTVEPWGQARGDIQAATAAWAATAPWAKDVSLADFLPRYGEESRQQELTPEQARAILLASGAVEVKRRG